MKKILSLLLTVAILAGIGYAAASVLHFDIPDTMSELTDIFDDLKTESHSRKTEDTQATPAVTPHKLFGPYDIVRVVDGDTAIINIDGEDTRVRFLGIDTPESVNPDESKNTEEGKIASEFTKDLLTGQQVFLEYDVTSEDDYGRMLAYIYLDDGVTMVEDILLKEGLATTMTIQPNSKYASHFYELLVEARSAGTGFWGTGFWD